MTKQRDGHGNSVDLNRGRDGKAGHQAGHGGPDGKPDGKPDGEPVHKNRREGEGDSKN